MLWKIAKAGAAPAIDLAAEMAKVNAASASFTSGAFDSL